MAASIASHLSISAVERDTGLSKDVLRVWERRYGFPLPERDGNGERLYSPQQVERLRHVRRLLDAGYRPGRLLQLPDAELLALTIDRAVATSNRYSAPDGDSTADDAGHVADHASPAANASELVGRCLVLARSGDGAGLASVLAGAALRVGLPSFVDQLLLPLLDAIDNARLHAELHASAGRLCREQLRRALLATLGALPVQSDRMKPTVLLATLPPDADDLHLIAFETLLRCEGVHCIALGTQVPVPELAAAAGAWRVDVVLPFFAAAQSPKVALATLDALRADLPDHVQIWAGGELIRRLRRGRDGVTLLDSPATLRIALQHWHRSRTVIDRGERE